MSEAYNESVRELLRDAARDLMQQTKAAKERHKVDHGYTQKLISVTRESAALAWAVNGKPVFAEVNGVVREITPVDNKPCHYSHERWSCGVLEDETAGFYINIGEDV